MVIRSLRVHRRFVLAASVFVAASGCSGKDRATEDASCAVTASESPVTLKVPTGTVHGTLRRPAGCGPHPIAVLIAGSGPTDRDGNAAPTVKTDAYAMLARALSDLGLASLRYDKRGIGQSRGAIPSESDLRIEHYSDDVAGWLNLLKEDNRFGKRVILGHSEGSLLGILALKKETAHAFISVAGPGRPAGQVLREQLRKLYSGSLFDAASSILDQLEGGNLVADLPNELMNIFRPSVQPYLISWLKYDPSRELSDLAVPTLVAQGTTDEQVGVLDAQLLAAARSDATLLLVDGMCHVLKMASREPADQQAAYTDPNRPLAPALVHGIDAFLDVVLAP